MNNHDNGRVRGLFHAVAMIVAFVCAAACALAVALGAGVAVAHADETGRAGGTGTIELKYEYQGESLEGDGVSLYRVADWDGGAFTLRDEYADADFGTDARGWDGLMDDLKEGKASAEQFQAAANTLDAYVRDLIIYQQVQQITALQEKVAELQRRIEHLTDVAAARNVATETAAATD